MSGGRSRLRVPVVLLLLAAALLWISSRTTWVEITAANDQSGAAVRAVSGADWQPGLVPFAIGALAAAAAVALARGRAARLVGAVLLLLATGMGVAAAGGVGEIDWARAHEVVTGGAGGPGGSAGGSTSAGTRSAGGQALPSWSEVTGADGRALGPGLAALAALAVAAAGASLLVWPPVAAERDRRFGRGDAGPSGAAPRTDPPGSATPARPEDGDAGRDLWNALDAGDDPTA